LLEIIGKGSYGEVWKGYKTQSPFIGSHVKCYDRINQETNETLAIKIIDLEDAEDEIDDIQQEINVLSQINESEFVTKYYGSCVLHTHLWIGMEFNQLH
jgi:serine/threonine-protein kinase 24/25/MST4